MDGHTFWESTRPDGSRWDLHYKGSGPTPSQDEEMASGTLGPMLRNTSSVRPCMHQIPSTRSFRWLKPSHCPTRNSIERGGLLRVAASHLRVGTFQWRQLNCSGGIRQLMDYTIQRHYPECQEDPHPARSFWSISCKDRSISSSIGCG